MKRLLKHHRLFLVTAAAGCALLGAGCGAWPLASPSPVNLQPLPSPQARQRITSEEIWHEDFSRARAIAEQKGRLLLLDFTGSNSCGWCIMLKIEVFETDTFWKWAQENVVLVEVDFPRHKSQPAAVRAQNERLKRKYRDRIRGYPTVLFVKPNGEVVGRSGYRPDGARAWIDHANSIIKQGLEDLALETLRRESGHAVVDEVGLLVRQLGFDRWKKREDATVRLIAMGPAVAKALQPYADSEDLEIRMRVRWIQNAEARKKLRIRLASVQRPQGPGPNRRRRCGRCGRRHLPPLNPIRVNGQIHRHPCHRCGRVHR